MKNSVFLVSILFMICFFSSFKSNDDFMRFSEQEQPAKYSKEQINNFIKEVYQDHANELFFNSKSKRLELVTDFLDRIEFVSSQKFGKKDIPLLSSLKLIDKYNPNLRRDLVFDPKTFNPLKYNFTLTLKTKTVVRVDGSEIVIVVQPAR